jgi:hypothetical protein
MQTREQFAHRVRGKAPSTSFPVVVVVIIVLVVVISVVHGVRGNCALASSAAQWAAQPVTSGIAMQHKVREERQKVGRSFECLAPVHAHRHGVFFSCSQTRLGLAALALAFALALTDSFFFFSFSFSFSFSSLKRHGSAGTKTSLGVNSAHAERAQQG